VQPGRSGLKNLVFQVSMNAVVPGATNAASTGSEGYSYGFTANIFKRQDYGANSTNFVTYATGSGGVTASLNYAATGVGGASQTFGLSWATDDSGGTWAFSTTSGAGNWSSFATGPKFLSIPFNQTYLSAGEYWLAVQHSSTTATSNSNVTLLSFSKLLQQWPVVSMGSFGGSATLAFSGVDGIGNRRGERDHHQHHHAGERDQRVYSAARLLRDQQRLGRIQFGRERNAHSQVVRSVVLPLRPSVSTTASWRSPPFASSRAGAGRSRTR
jgi:hypothetical protein